MMHIIKPLHGKNIREYYNKYILILKILQMLKIKNGK